MALIFNGTRIVSVVYNETPIAIFNYNTNDVWRSTGVFYGGSLQWVDGDPNSGWYTNLTTRINSDGVMLGTETAVGSYLIEEMASGRCSSVGVYHGGSDWNYDWTKPLPNWYTETNITTRINSDGVMVGSHTLVGEPMKDTYGGATFEEYGIVLFHGTSIWYTGGTPYFISTSRTKRINSDGNLLTNDISLTAKLKNYFSGTKAGTVALYYGGTDRDPVLGWFVSTQTERFNGLGAMVGSQTTLNVTAVSFMGAATIGGIANFYGGDSDDFNTGYLTNSLLRIDQYGSMVGSILYVGSNKNGVGSATFGHDGIGNLPALFYGGTDAGFGGTDWNYWESDTCTRIDQYGSIVGVETTLGSPRHGVGGAGL